MKIIKRKAKIIPPNLPEPPHSPAKKRKQDLMDEPSSPVFPPPLIDLPPTSPTSTIYSFLRELTEGEDSSNQDSRPSLNESKKDEDSSSGTSSSSNSDSSSNSETSSNSSSSSSSSSTSSSSSSHSNRFAQGKQLPPRLPPSPFQRVDRQDRYFPQSDVSYFTSSSNQSYTSTGSSGSSSHTVIHPSQVRRHVFYPTRQSSSSADSTSRNNP